MFVAWISHVKLPPCCEGATEYEQKNKKKGSTTLGTGRREETKVYADRLKLMCLSGVARGDSGTRRKSIKSIKGLRTGWVL